MKTKKRSHINWLFLFVVVVPTLISTYYFSSVASSIYISEAHFVVRSPQRQTMSGLSAMLQGVGFSHSQNDSYAVHDYVLSRDALKVLDEKFDFRKMFTDKKLDLFNRFGALDFDTSFEALFKYYQKRIDIEYDTVSAITKVKVKLFSPDMAYEVNEELFKMMEKFISQLNKRGRTDMLKNAKEELSLSENEAMKARINIANYRSKTSTVDPSKQSETQLLKVAKLEDELLKTKTQLIQLKRVASGNSQIRVLETSIRELKSEIRKEKSKITGKNKASLVSKSSQYEQLIMEQEFANKHYSAAVVAYQQALEEVQRKQLYLERIVQPNKPDYTLYPRRVRAIITTLIFSLLLWGILHMLLAGVREHTH